MSSFTNIKETNTSSDQHIEEPRGELRNAVYRDERREIEAAPELALAGREVIRVEQEALMNSEPPF